jgi:hypothetical protein
MRAYCCLMLVISFALTSAFAQGNETIIPCQDVTKLDFKNLTFSNGIHHNTRQFAFKNGVAQYYDDPEIQKSGPPDWRAEIERDTVVQPSRGTAVRFLLIYQGHLTGTGWIYWLVGYSCVNGRLRQVFSRDGLSLKIERLDDSGIVVSKSVKYGSLVETHWSYLWDKAQLRYVLASKWSGSAKKSTNPQ